MTFALIRRRHKRAEPEIVQLWGRPMVAHTQHILKKRFLEATGFCPGAYRRHGFAELRIDIEPWNIKGQGRPL